MIVMCAGIVAVSPEMWRMEVIFFCALKTGVKSGAFAQSTLPVASTDLLNQPGNLGPTAARRSASIFLATLASCLASGGMRSQGRNWSSAAKMSLIAPPSWVSIKSTNSREGPPCKSTNHFANSSVATLPELGLSNGLPPPAESSLPP